jgi:hypothetical protein
MTRSTAYLALNDRAEAYTCFEQFRDLVETHGIHYYRGDVERLEAAF